LIATNPTTSPRHAFSNQLKKLYRDISHLETKLLADSGEPQDDESHVVIKGGPSAGANEVEKARWKNLIEDHKWYAPVVFLSDLYHSTHFLDAQPDGDLSGIWCPRFATIQPARQ
jgi:hypothetical protein